MLAIFTQGQEGEGTCHQCGEKLKADKKFCVDCGAPVALTSFAPTKNKKVCQKCGNRVKVQAKICELCGTLLSDLSAQSAKQLSAGNQTMPISSARWPAVWEPPPIRKLMPPSTPPVGKVFRLTVAAPYLNTVRGVSSGGRWGRALLTLGVGMFILPLFDLRLLGAAQPGIAFLLGIVGVVLMIAGGAGRRNQPSSIAPGQQTSHFSNQGSIRTPSVTRRCSRCNQAIPEEDRFCTSCGALPI